MSNAAPCPIRSTVYPRSGGDIRGSMGGTAITDGVGADSPRLSITVMVIQPARHALTDNEG
jgi:hypothetical protein